MNLECECEFGCENCVPKKEAVPDDEADNPPNYFLESLIFLLTR